ncbi:ABC transporter family substrate-binding protein [Corynebacterium tapiri]|uniref:ABC transporter family substrate-binding protein n=1 Tax=Corynebacterium tapiri TaxID=1448266 RepID=A0A5C4U4M5_9CORY|nr:ABC transporter family substrate-binding protein [Corynebacterium tapiri]TNL96826.1 ABC transporter family substrate-binding protein [Corynebacterium tapiri]
MRSPLRTALVASVTSFSLILGACSGGASDEEKYNADSIAAADLNEKPRDEIQDGGTLTTAIAEISEQQNVFHADSTRYSSDVSRYYMPTLALFDGEGNYTPNPDYLTNASEETKDGNTVVTFDIVDKATFNDGTPIDVKAFETTWKINNGTNPAYSPAATDGYERITSVEQGDSPKQVKVTFDGAYAFWQGLFNQVAHPAMADPANYNDFINKVHPEWGAGPFKVEYFDPQKGEVKFVRNEKWWGDPAKLDARVMRQMEDSASINAFRNGEINATGVANKNRYATVKNMKGIDIRVAARTSKSLLTLNAKADNLSDPKVRQAIMTGINRDQIGQIIFNGIPYSETPPGSLTNYPFQKSYEDNFSTAVEKFDPEAAKKLLDEAGWTQAEGAQFREKDGKPLTLRYVLMGDSETSRAMAMAIQAMMKDLGVDLQVQERPSSDFSKVVTTYDFDVFPMGFNSGDPYGVAYFGQMYRSGSQLNRSQTGNAEFDAKIDELQDLPTADEQIKRGNELEKEAFKFYGLAPLYNGADMVAVKEDLANYGPGGFAVLPTEDIGYVKK